LKEPIKPADHGTGLFFGGRYSKEEVIKFGGISENVAKGMRSSDRIRAQPNADATQIERAQERAVGTSKI
jgi:hypothetical protein